MLNNVGPTINVRFSMGRGKRSIKCAEAVQHSHLGQVLKEVVNLKNIIKPQTRHFWFFSRKKNPEVTI